MPILVRFGSWLLGGFIALIPSAVGSILVALGIGVVTYSGLDVTINWLKSDAVSALLGLPSNVVGMLALMKVGTSINMIFSAIVARLTFIGAAGAVKKFVKK